MLRRAHAAVPLDAGQDRPREPGHAREALGHPRHPRVRAQRLRGAALRRGEHATSRTPSSRSTGMFALMMPLLMGIFNFSTVAIIWFGAYRVDSGGMPIGNLTAFLAYIMQILMSVMMASSCSSWSRAQRPPRRPHQGGARHRAVGQRPRDSRRRDRPARLHRVPRRGVPLPRRRGPGAVQHLVLGVARARRRRSSAAPAAASRRSSTSSPASTTSRAAPCSSTASTSAR